MNPLRRLRSAVAIAVAAVVLLAAAGIFVNSELVSHPASTVAEASPTPILVGCVTPALVLTGAINGCASVLEGMGCPHGSFDMARVVHLRGSGGDYILYLEVDGGYQGPGTYALAPWKKDTLLADDNVAKVAMREWNGGRLWESYAGSLTIDSSEESGRVEADLRLPDKTSSPILHLQGPWTCP